LVLVVGIGLRFANLDRKIYWHDEVYTSMRAAGFTRYEIDQNLFRNRFIPAPNLQWYQQPKFNSTLAETIYSLAIEDPQHPPLYFLLARFWMLAFGSSIGVSRVLPALLSLLGLPLMYALVMELFGSPFTALLATTFLAISPFDILFAQTNRQYSLLTSVVIGSSWLLLRAIRKPTWWNWGLYTLSMAIGLYTHPFFVLTIAAQGVYVLLMSGEVARKRVAAKDVDLAVKRRFSPILLARLRFLLQFGMAILEALILYSPWLAVMLVNRERALATTDWARAAVDPVYLLKLWTLSFTSLFIDLDFGFDNPVTFLLRLPFLLLLAGAIYVLCRTTPRRAWLFVVLSIAVPFLLLAIPDFMSGGKRSAVSRYLISCYPGIQIAVAYLLGVGLVGKAWHWRRILLQKSQRMNYQIKSWSDRRVWLGVLATVFTASLISGGVSAMAKTWWDKDLSYQNAEVIEIVNKEAQNSSPVLVSDIGDDYTNTGDLISLSYGLQDKVRLYTVERPADLEPLTNEDNVILFRPSNALRTAIKDKGWVLQPFYTKAKLWQVKR
jgi:uncharacterized membrane protein